MIVKSQRRYSVAYVDPEFHRLLKVKSAEEDLSLVDFTKKLAEMERTKISQNYGQNQVKRKWNFEL